MNTFSNIFKKSFLDGFASADISIESVIASLCMTLVIATYIFFVYRILTRKTFYSKNFNISLVGVALITSTIIVTIQSSVVVSLGMVGALSIVRFRTAIKDPMDLMFLFWSISIGIICGAGFGEYAIALSLVLTVAVIVLNKIPMVKADMLLVINSQDTGAEKNIMSIVEKYAKHPHIKSRNMTKSALDIVIELKTVNGAELLNELNSLKEINNVSLMSHDGEVTF